MTSPLPRLERRLLVAWAATLLVLLVGAVSLVRLRQQAAARAELERSAAVVQTLEAVRLALVDGETGQRGYALTGNAEFLEPYVNVRPAVEAGLSSLSRLLAGDGPQLKRLQALRLQAAAALALLDANVAIRARDGSQAAIRHTQTALGKSAMDAARAQVSALVAGERVLLAVRHAEAELQLERSQAAIALGSLLAFALALSVQLALARAVRERRADEARLRLQATLLEEHGRAVAAVNQSLAERLTELSTAHQETEQMLVERDAAAVALARSNRELDQFAYVASHDLKAPLRGVAHLATWIEEELGTSLNPTVRDHLKMMHRRVNRMEALINGILEYSRIGRVKTVVEPVDVAALLREVFELTGIDPGCVTVTLAPAARRLSAQRVPLQQVLMNLLGNAAKHGRDAEGRLRLEVLCASEGERLCFTVRDHGPGIESRYHQRIFGVFQTLAARDRVEGTGIGLALVQKLVEHQGGKVWLQSALGEGSAFHFTWPLQARAEAMA